MSAFFAKCPDCGTAYFHCFVATTLHSGHSCPESSKRLAEGYRAMEAEAQAIHSDMAPLSERTWPQP